MARYATLENDVESDLARYWIRSANRATVTAAQHLIDTKLADDPFRFGTHLSEGLWKVEVPPLKEFYEIDDAKKTVKITAIDCKT